MQETERWTFSYIGADIDFSKVSAETNIGITNVVAFAGAYGGQTLSAPSGLGHAVGAGIENYMNNRIRGMSYTANLYEGLSSNEYVSYGGTTTTGETKEKVKGETK
jgi:hypothetical protein